MNYLPGFLRKACIAICLPVCICGFISNAYAQNAAPTKPNIIFILADDVGFYTPRVNGGQSYSTPNIDSMARHGINFTHCESSPLCCTSRSMFLTGKYLNRNYSNWGYMNDNGKTVGNVMKDAGYVTGIFGKFQFQYSVARMRNWGWDRHILFELTEDTMAYSRYKNPVLKENGYRIPDSQTANKYCDDILTNRILKFIDSNKTRPFFAFYSMSIGHHPFSPTPDDAAFANWNPKQGDTSYYPSMMKYMDKKIGLILQKLKQTGLANNTIVMFAGDNGTPVTISFNANGKKGIKGEKGETTEGGTHVPLVVYWPGHIQEGSVNDDLIDFTDFLPTFAQAGKLASLNSYGKLDGTSFYPKILGNPGKTKKQLYCFYAPENARKASNKIWVRDKTYKLYDSTGFEKSGNFYNITKDPRELSPLKDNNLTTSEKSTKANFKIILDTSYYWPDCPTIVDPFAKNITSSSATIGATITAQGASMLKERGSSLSTTAKVFLGTDRLRAGNVNFGTFSQQRIGLKPQTEYQYMVYAMNENASHSTASVQGTFTTLSKAPLQQPGKFAATTTNTTIDLEWNDALFPREGANRAGYLLLHSTGEISLIEDAQGKAPENIIAEGNLLSLSDTALPLLPGKKASFPDFRNDNIHNFMLIPYTWDGKNASTYNYLIKDARKVQIMPSFIAYNAASDEQLITNKTK